MPVNCFKVGQIGFHVEVKEAKSKARLGFPETWVRLKSSQIEGVVLHLEWRNPKSGQKKARLLSLAFV